jgi:HK97 family phage prohead protease
MTKPNNIRREIFVPGAGLRVRESGGENEKAPRIIEGHAILFNVPSAVLWEDQDEIAREVIAPEAVTQELLDSSDIKLTMFHNRELVLGRSNKGSGTLKYEIDEVGVKFTCEVPDTADGDKAYNLVSRGDISGCSFAFYVPNGDAVTLETSTVPDGRREKTYTVRAIAEIVDFTLALDPAYPQTDVNARDIYAVKQPAAPETMSDQAKAQVRELRNLSRKTNNY